MFPIADSSTLPARAFVAPVSFTTFSISSWLVHRRPPPTLLLPCGKRPHAHRRGYTRRYLACQADFTPSSASYPECHDAIAARETFDALSRVWSPAGPAPRTRRRAGAPGRPAAGRARGWAVPAGVRYHACDIQRLPPSGSGNRRWIAARPWVRSPSVSARLLPVRAAAKQLCRARPCRNR